MRIRLSNHSGMIRKSPENDWLQPPSVRARPSSSESYRNFRYQLRMRKDCHHLSEDLEPSWFDLRDPYSGLSERTDTQPGDPGTRSNRLKTG